MNYQEALTKGTKILKSNKIKSFILDSEILLASSLKLDRSRLLLNLNNNIASQTIRKIDLNHPHCISFHYW